MVVDYVKNGEELDRVLEFVQNVLSGTIGFIELPHTRDFWMEMVGKKSDLLLYASDENKIIASAFAFIENNNNATMAHLCVDNNYRNKGIGKELMSEIESRIKNMGCTSIALGSLESAEGFYKKMGYSGSLLVQSEKTSIDELLSLNKTYNVAWTNIYEGKINQICLSLSQPDRTLQRKYEETFDECYTQMVFQKILG